MSRSLNPAAGVVRAVVALAILAAIVVGVYIAYKEFVGVTSQTLLEMTNENRALRSQLGDLEDQLEIARLENERLNTALRLLKVDTRVAQIDVLSQEGSADNGDLATHFTFVELDGQGEPLDRPRQFRVAGDVVYVESWVVKFTDEYVEMGDPLRSTSLCLFRRLFGEAQRPMDGFDLDTSGSQPGAYRTGSKPSELEQEIWQRFWELANNPSEAQKLGVRVVHGEAPFQKMESGKRYKVLLRASGGLSFATEDLPPDAQPAPTAETL